MKVAVSGEECCMTLTLRTSVKQTTHFKFHQKCPQWYLRYL